MKYLFTTLLLGVALMAGAQTRSVNFETTTFGEALEKAARQNKILFVDCYTDWCGPCKMLDREVFHNDEVADYMNSHFVSLKVDCEKGEGPEIAKRFQVSGYPTLLFIGADGEVVNRMMGASTPENFLRQVKEGLGENSLAAKLKRYENGERGLEFMLGLFEDVVGIRDHKMIAVVGNSILEVVPRDELFTSQMWDVVGNYYVSRYGNPWWEFIIENSDKYIGVVGAQRFGRKIGETLHPYIFGFAVGSRVASDPRQMEELRELIERFGPQGKETLLSYLRLARSRSFDPSESYFATVSRELADGLPANEHYRFLANALDYLIQTSDDTQRGELVELVRTSYNKQNEYTQQAYEALFTKLGIER